MSRTYKDRPYWVRLNDPRETRTSFHHHEDRGRFFEAFEECLIDLPYEGAKGEWRRHCGYYLGYRRHVCDVPSGAVREGYYSPLRNDERMVLRNSVKQYNTFGEIDEDFYIQEQHRHACYGGGYWD